MYHPSANFLFTFPNRQAGAMPLRHHNPLSANVLGKKKAAAALKKTC